MRVKLPTFYNCKVLLKNSIFPLPIEAENYGYQYSGSINLDLSNVPSHSLNRKFALDSLQPHVFHCYQIFGISIDQVGSYSEISNHFEKNQAGNPGILSAFLLLFSLRCQSSHAMSIIRHSIKMLHYF